MARTKVTDSPNPLRRKKGWRASVKRVFVHCPEKKCGMKGDAAENAVSDTTPYLFRAICPVHEVPLVVGKKKVGK